MKRRLNRLREGALFASLSCLLLSALLFLLPLHADANTTGGDDDRGVSAEMRLTPDVDTTGFAGDAKISIPIVVPPGRAGMAPSLTLSYSSSAGNGWIGTGWNIETGFIQRQTKFGLNYADDTSFAFRSAGASGDLVSLGSGNFGMKIETEFSKFQYISGYWQVTARDGKRYYYGQTSDARQTNSAGQIFKWLLNRIEDPNGNYITFSYVSDARETYVYEIRYTGNSSGLSPTSLVRFHYMGRNDALTYGIGRDLVNVNKLLKAIEVKAASEATSVRVYGFEYAEASHTREPILNKIQQYDNSAYYYASTGQIIGGNALPPIVITADSSQTTIPYGTHSVEPQSKVDLNYKFVIGDFNGDNLTDYMWLHTYLDERVVYLRQGNGSFNSGTYSSGGGVYRSGWKFVTGDFDGDGRTDYMILSINTNERFVYRSNGAGNFLSAVRTAGDVSYNLYATWNLTTGDFNGDGKTDIMWINPTNNKRTVYLSAGNGQFNAGLTSGENVNYSAYQFTTGDFNGDGRTDYMWVDMYQNKRAVYISSGTGGFSAPVSTNDGRNYSLTTWNVTTGDFNGDGKTDYMWVRGDYNQCAVYLGLGNGGFAPVVLNTLGSTYSNVWQLHAGDFNGDGKTDIILVKNAEDKRMLHLSRGDGYFLPAMNNSFTTGIDYNSYTYGIWDFVTGDYNGDGKTDYMYINKYKRKRYVALANPVAPQGLVSSIKNSTGGTTSFQYTHSTNFSNTYLPYVMPLVTVVSLNDGLNNVSTRQYAYAQGKHDISLREFQGFGYVRTVQPDSSIVETNYHQDEYLKGRIKNTTLKTPGGGILMSRSNSWSAAVMSGRWRFVKLDQSTTVYDNYSSYYTTLDYLYDSTHGNVTRIVTSGTSAEPVTTIFGYANYSGWLWRPTSITVTGSSTGTVRQTTFDYYSGTGNLRLQKNWDLADDSKSQVTTMEYY
ncbi:MAG: hypothetical protein HPY65_06565 [Syntrophaceae bacterium]|nr:hypothetical protein [Syntrophaceae bacterium]